ncbi:MAG: hypothetical protein Q4B28_04445 [bacterium]|nr:hypothetical protein [bacterium]
MKKTDFKRYNNYTANLADGLELNEAEKMQRTSAKTRKLEQNRAWLKSQEAELASLTAQTNEALLDTLETKSNLTAKVRQLKLQTKDNLHQVFTLNKDNEVARVA